MARIWQEFGKNVQETFEIIAENPEYTAEKIAIETTNTSRTIENHLSKLKEANIVRRIGPKLGGYWEIEQ